MSTSELLEEVQPPEPRPLPLPRREAVEGLVYGRSFWMAFVANFCVTTAMSLLFRYADFVQALGGTAQDLGFIVGVGMVGALFMRLAQGLGVDRFGPRRVWLASLMLLAASCAGHLLVTSLHSPEVYLFQIGIRTALAGALGASITYISYQVPPTRAAEMIGAVGTSGFVGIMAGTAVGDLVGSGEVVVRADVDRIFLICAGLSIVAGFFAWGATLDPVRPAQRRMPPVIAVVRRFHPGVLLLVAMAIGIGLGMPGVFIRPFAKDNGITVLAWFFWTYAPTALFVRLATRRWPTIYGPRPLIIAGLSLAILGCVSLIFVTQGWHFILAGLFFGTCHAVMFPSVTGAGSTSFPARYRGIGVALILAMYDLGALVGSPMGGSVHTAAKSLGFSPWPIVFSTFAGVLVLIAITYAVVSGRKVVCGRKVVSDRKKSSAPTTNAAP